MRPASRLLARACLPAVLLPCCFTYAAPPESIRAAIRAAAAGYDPGLVERHLARITRRDA